MSLHGVERASLPLNLADFGAIIDVRSPAEFAEDHLPGAINLPVLDDEERARVGTLYKQSPFQARKLGAALISRNAARFLDEDLCDHGKDWAPLLYCWRGGMRSRSFATVLRSVGWRARVLEGDAPLTMVNDPVVTTSLVSEVFRQHHPCHPGLAFGEELSPFSMVCHGHC